MSCAPLIVTWLFLGGPEHEVIWVLDGLRDVGHELPGQAAVGVLLVAHRSDVHAQPLRWKEGAS